MLAHEPATRLHAHVHLLIRQHACTAPQKCGTTSLAAYLKLHPALSGIAGMPGHGERRQCALPTMCSRPSVQTRLALLTHRHASSPIAPLHAAPRWRTHYCAVLLAGVSPRPCLAHPPTEALSKESHFFGGLLGRGHAASAALYRSCFPTVITR